MAKAIIPIINPDTGEVLKETSPLKDLSEARKVIAMKIKAMQTQVEEIDAILAPVIEDLIEKGERQLCDYWNISSGGHKFNMELFLANANKKQLKAYEIHKKALKEIESNIKFQKEGKPYLRFPKLS